MNRREFLGTTFSSAALILAASLDTKTLHAATRSAPVSECESGLHVVVHKPTGRSKSFGELASTASNLSLPAQSELKLKARSEWR